MYEYDRRAPTVPICQGLDDSSTRLCVVARTKRVQRWQTPSSTARRTIFAVAFQPPQERLALLLTRILQARCLTTYRLSHYLVRNTAPRHVHHNASSHPHQTLAIANLHVCWIPNIIEFDIGQLVLDQIVQQTNATARQVRTIARNDALSQHGCTNSASSLSFALTEGIWHQTQA